MLADLVKKHLEQLGRLLAGLHHEIEHIQTRQDPIPLGDVAAEGIPAALLAADHGVRFHHLGSDVFEAYARFINRDIIELAQLVQHGRRGQGLDDRAALAADLQQIERHQGIHAQLVDELTVLVTDAAAVRIPVRDQEDIGLVLHSRLQTNVDIWTDGLRTFHLREGGVARIVDLDYPGLATLEQTAEPAAAVAPHGIHHDRKAGILDPLDIDQLMQIGNIGFTGIENNHLAIPHCVIQGEALHIRHRLRDGALDAQQPVGVDRTAVRIADLESVVGGRIVRGRDVDRAARLSYRLRHRRWSALAWLHLSGRH